MKQKRTYWMHFNRRGEMTGVSAYQVPSFPKAQAKMISLKEYRAIRKTNTLPTVLPLQPVIEPLKAVA